MDLILIDVSEVIDDIAAAIAVPPSGIILFPLFVRVQVLGF